jgi:hypothetical protein
MHTSSKITRHTIVEIGGRYWMVMWKGSAFMTEEIDVNAAAPYLWVI